MFNMDTEQTIKYLMIDYVLVATLIKLSCRYILVITIITCFFIEEL